MTPEERRLYLRHLEERLESEPGVSAAVVTRRVPFGMGFSGRIRIEGGDPDGEGRDKPALRKSWPTTAELRLFVRVGLTYSNGEAWGIGNRPNGWRTADGYWPIISGLSY